MLRVEIDERTMDDVENKTEYVLAQRFYCALLHPGNPVPMFDMDARKLSRHMAVRLSRMPGPRKFREKVIEG